MWSTSPAVNSFKAGWASRCGGYRSGRYPRRRRSRGHYRRRRCRGCCGHHTDPGPCKRSRTTLPRCTQDLVVGQHHNQGRGEERGLRARLMRVGRIIYLVARVGGRRHPSARCLLCTQTLSLHSRSQGL